MEQQNTTHDNRICLTRPLGRVTRKDRQPRVNLKHMGPQTQAHDSQIQKAIH